MKEQVLMNYGRGTAKPESCDANKTDMGLKLEETSSRGLYLLGLLVVALAESWELLLMWRVEPY